MFITAENLTSVSHGFFTRKGGVSTGLYDSLNCGYGSSDNRDHITENRRRVAEALGCGGGILTVHQIHSAECVTIHEPFLPGDEPKADALVTDRPGIILGILTADCGPVLFQGRKGDGSSIIGAAHAGWGGAVKGILENTIEAMRSLGAKTIAAAIGPCIGPLSYEVSSGFEQPFLTDDSKAARFFTPGKREDHQMFNLPAYIHFRLQRSDIDSIWIANRDTCAEDETFFSYRRSVLNRELDYGRQVSAIVVRP